MFDVANREIAHRGIVLCSIQDEGLQFGIIDNIYEDEQRAIVTIVYEDGGEDEEHRVDAHNIFNVAHRQLPKSIKDKLIAMSGDSWRNTSDNPLNLPK